MYKTKREQIVELLIPATITGNNQQTYFQNQPQLQSVTGDRRVYIKSIEAYTDENLIGSPLSNGVNMATAADLQNAVLVLSIEGENQINMIPLSSLSSIYSSAATTTPVNYQRFLLKNQFRVDWSKSYVQTIQAPGSVPFTYVFRVDYDYEPDYDDMTAPEIEEFLEYASKIPNYPLSFKR